MIAGFLLGVGSTMIVMGIAGLLFFRVVHHATFNPQRPVR